MEVELPTHMYQPLFARARRVNTATTLCACLSAILVLTIGVIGGVYLYRQLSRAQVIHLNKCSLFLGHTHKYFDLSLLCNQFADYNLMHVRLQVHRLRAWCNVPYNSLDVSGNLYQNKPQRYMDYPDSTEEKTNTVYFRQDFEIDEYGTYEEIAVPDFTGGRRGRFIHDFSAVS